MNCKSFVILIQLACDIFENNTINTNNGRILNVITYLSLIVVKIDVVKEFYGIGKKLFVTCV